MNKELIEYNALALQRLDLLLHREIFRLRANYQLSLDEFRGLYISDEQVDAYINKALASHPDIHDIDVLTKKACDLHSMHASKIPRQWRHVVEEFGLNGFEQDVLLLALALEIDLKYETLYGYLNNDVTLKYPTIDLALRVFRDDATSHHKHRQSLSPHAKLFAYGLLENVVGNNTLQRSSLAAGFRLTPALVNYLTDIPLHDPKLSSVVTLNLVEHEEINVAPIAQAVKNRVKQLATLFRSKISPDFVVVEGVEGCGRKHAGRLLCKQLGLCIIEINSGLLSTSDENDLDLLTRILLLARLHGAGILFNAFDVLMQDDPARLRILTNILPRLAAVSVPILLTVQPQTLGRESLKSYRVVNLELPEPDITERRRLWNLYLHESELNVSAADIDDLVERFILTNDQVRAAIDAAIVERALKANGEEKSNRDVLFKAARDQSIGEIGKLAQKVSLKFSWNDLVLPRPTLKRVKEITAAIQHRNKVYKEWGMERRVHNANGLMVLFSGASGTGKTMTASVIARNIGLHLYRIDLSGIVSKYIGETEKNLDKIFAGVRRANAILFFDEADALFGKRSEVKDAHDRYANIEVAYLLQKMEEHDGVVILATNLSKNMDQAFSRRMHYVVEFPKPSAEHRERLWRGIFPLDTPVTEDVDFVFLAKQFDNTGGDIKNIALDAAFLAAENGQRVEMEQLIKAMSRQMIKQGKVPSATDFKQYHGLIDV